MSTDLKRRLTKTVSSNLQRTTTDKSVAVNKLERSYTTLGTSSEQTSVPAFASIASSACYQREASSLSTASLPATSPMKRTASKSKIPLPTFSRESLTASTSTLGVSASTTSLAESLTGAPAAKTFRNVPVKDLHIWHRFSSQQRFTVFDRENPSPFLFMRWASFSSHF